MRKTTSIALLSFFLLQIFALSYAQYSGSLGNLGTTLGRLCGDLTGILPIVAMVGVVGGGVIYGAGQLMGAETRARANVWATALLTGAVISVLIVAVAPSVISTLYGSTVTCSSGSTIGGNTAHCGSSITYNPSTSRCCSSGSNFWTCPISASCYGTGSCRSSIGTIIPGSTY